MSLRQELYRGTNDIDFIPIWRRSLPTSVGLVLVSLLMLVVLGLNLSIDFDGGGIFEVPVSEETTVVDARNAISVPDTRIQTVEDLDGNRFIRVQVGSEDLDQSDSLVTELAELGGVTPDDVSVNTVGPTWGEQITERAIEALVFFLLAVAVYLAWRLEWRMAVGALVAVVHDLIITTGFYALFQFEVSPATVIALLTIMGYSLYDTVVVYDKVLENQSTVAGQKLGNSALISSSMNQVLMRSINTTITTVLPVVSMLVIGGFFLGGASLRDFTLALFIGLLLGTYSSVFVAAPLLVWLRENTADEGGGALFLGFDGRIGRAQFWIGNLVVAAITLAGWVALRIASSSFLVLLAAVVLLALVWPTLAIDVKRWHDRGKSGWWVLVVFVPIVGTIWRFVELGFLKGTVGANDHGPDPVGSSVRR